MESALAPKTGTGPEAALKQEFGPVLRWFAERYFGAVRFSPEAEAELLICEDVRPRVPLPPQRSSLHDPGVTLWVERLRVPARLVVRDRDQQQRGLVSAILAAE